MMNVVLRGTLRHPLSALLGATAGALELLGSIKTRSRVNGLARCPVTACDWFDAIVDVQFRQCSLMDYARDRLATWREWE